MRRAGSEAEVVAGQLFDVHVAERDDPYRGHEAGLRLAVHVPDPRIVQLELDVGAPTLDVDGLVHPVREVEAALRLDHVLERRRDVPVLLEELVLDLGLVLLEVVRAHRRTSDRAVTSTLPLRRGTGEQLPPVVIVRSPRLLIAPRA